MHDRFVKKMSTPGDADLASGISHPTPLRSGVMRQAEFESLLFVDVEKRAATEPAPAAGEPRYYGRPWTRVRDEMLATGSLTVGDLPRRDIARFYRTTNSEDNGGGVMSALRGLFGGS